MKNQAVMISDLKHFLSKRKYVIAAAIGALVLAYFVNVNDRRSATAEIVYSSETTVVETEQVEVIFETSATTLASANTTVYVYMCGAVNSPGVYEVDRGVLLNDAIILAGGLRQDAASDHLNLVMTINENLSVYIPTNEEVMEDLYHSEVIVHDSVSSESPASSEVGSDKVNINTASRAELMTVPGIGEVTADAIVSYRDSHGSFKSVDELMNVDGIGQGKFNKFKEYFCI
ncbi:MAG: helix-hairpin-helix domain-containing protein [Saccharofermentans sp.]|nr:helix-hairpin-helix domain-containing protein [Saccharofermentans sp.]